MVYKTENPQESLNFLVSMHNKIKKLMDRNSTEFQFPAVYDDFNKQQKRSDTMTVGKMFTSMMSTMKGFGPESIAKLNEGFESMREFYEFMQHDDNFEEKLNFLDSFTKKQRALLVTIFDPDN
jgi:hypothetical protein